jgi:hypothetical protein
MRGVTTTGTITDDRNAAPCAGGTDITNTQGGTMKITRFAVLVSLLEGKKKSISIAQIKEVLRIANVLLGGLLYKLIRTAEERV